MAREKHTPRILIIVPAFNEAETIDAVLNALQAEVPECDVVVIDDGSEDSTATRVARHPGVILIRLPYNMGIGAAMQTGYLYALRHGYDVAIQCDADGQHPAEAIPRLLDRLARGDANLVIGSRYVADSDYVPSFSRRVGKSILSRLVDLLIGGGITDTTSGFRAADRSVIALFADDYPDDYPEAEALVLLNRAGLRAVEVPVQMRPRQGGTTSIRPAHAVYYMVKVALAIFIGMLRPSRKKISRQPGESL